MPASVFAVGVPAPCQARAARASLTARAQQDLKARIGRDYRACEHASVY
jgi:hypothetical protein